MTAALLTHVGAAMRDPVHATQQAFRALLTAMSLPGRVVELPPACIDGIVAPAGDDGQAVGLGLTALLLTLLDRDTTVRLHGHFASHALHHYLRFHTGVRESAPAAFEVLPAAELNRALCASFELGSDEEPQRGATLIVAVPSLDPAEAPPLLLRGAGIEDAQRLPVGSLEPSVWRWRIEQQTEFPRGVDMVFVHGLRIVALPRSTRIEEAR